MESHDASPPGSSGNGMEEERRASAARVEEVRRSQRAMGDWKRRIARRAAEMARLTTEGDKLMEECKDWGDRIVELEDELGRIHGLYQEDAQKRINHLRNKEERLKQTEELLRVRSVELAGAQSFLSTVDRLSEAEVLNIVRDLNEEICQVAIGLTEEWEKFQSSQVIGLVDTDLTSPAYAPVLVQLARNRNPVGLTFMIQSCLCSQAAKMTSRWAHYPPLATFRSVYQRLSDSGEHRHTLQVDGT